MRYRPFVSAEAMFEAQRRKTRKVEPATIPLGGSTGQVLKKSSGADYHASWQDDNAGSADLKPFCVTGSGSDIPAAETIQDLSSVQVTNSNYAVALDVITVLAAGTYQVSYSIQIDEDNTSGGTRGRVSSFMKNGLTAIPQSYGGVYTREASGGTGLSATFLVTLGAAATLSLFTDQDGNGTPNLSAERVQVSILKVA